MRIAVAVLVLAVGCGDPGPSQHDAGTDAGALGPPCEPSGRRCELGVELCAWGTGACRNPGLCRAIPSDCSGVAVAPVCGCDGVTYESECEANRAQQSVRTLGACE